MKILAIAVLGLAFLKMPYGYYVLLRWVICPISLYIAWQSHNDNNSG